MLTTKCWMTCLPSALTIANEGQRKRGAGGGGGRGGGGGGGGGVIEKREVCFLTSSIAAGKDNRS